MSFSLILKCEDVISRNNYDRHPVQDIMLTARLIIDPYSITRTQLLFLLFVITSITIEYEYKCDSREKLLAGNKVL